MRCLLVVLLCVSTVASVSAQRARDQVLTQELVVGLAPGQQARLRVVPYVASDFEARSTLINVFADDGQLLASTGRTVLPRGTTTPIELTFAHSGAGRRIVRFQYQLGGVPRGVARGSAPATRPGAPGTLEVFESGASSPTMLVPVPAFASGGAAASCALPSSGPNGTLVGRSSSGRVITGTFPLVPVARGQALEFTLADTVPDGFRHGARLGLTVELADETGRTVLFAPATTLDAPGIHRNVWVYGTELPGPSSGEAADVTVRYAITCDGVCDDIGRWLVQAQPVGAPLTPGVHVFDTASGRGALSLLLPGAQAAGDVDGRDFLVWQRGGDSGGDSPPPPPPPPPPNS